MSPTGRKPSPNSRGWARMPEVDPILDVRASWLPPFAAVPRLGQSALLQMLEVMLEPLVAVLSLWLLAWWIEDEVRPAWLIASVVVFALSFPGRRQLRLPARKVVVGTVV